MKFTAIRDPCAIVVSLVVALAPAAADDEEWLAGLVPDDDPAG